MRMVVASSCTATAPPRGGGRGGRQAGAAQTTSVRLCIKTLKTTLPPLLLIQVKGAFSFVIFDETQQRVFAARCARCTRVRAPPSACARAPHV